MLNLYYIKYFLDVCKTKSLTKAAERNFISPTAISLALGKLEESFGVQLILKKGRQFKLTSQGERLFQEGQSLILRAEELYDHVAHNKASLKPLRIGTPVSFGRSLLPPVLKKFSKNWPDLDIKLKLSNPIPLETYLEDEIVDFVFTRFRIRNKGFHRIPLYKGKFHLVSKNPGSLSESDQIIISDPLPETKALKSEYKKIYGKNLPVKYELNSWEAIKSMVDAGSGIGLLPDFMLLDSNLSILETPFDLPDYTLGILTRPGISQYSQGIKECLDSFIAGFKESHPNSKALS